MSEKNNDFHYL